MPNPGFPPWATRCPSVMYAANSAAFTNANATPSGSPAMTTSVSRYTPTAARPRADKVSTVRLPDRGKHDHGQELDRGDGSKRQPIDGEVERAVHSGEDNAQGDDQPARPPDQARRTRAKGAATWRRSRPPTRSAATRHQGRRHARTGAPANDGSEIVEDRADQEEALGRQRGGERSAERIGAPSADTERPCHRLTSSRVLSDRVQRRLCVTAIEDISIDGTARARSAFREVARLASFSQAASPARLRPIDRECPGKSLERDLGVRLFDWLRKERSGLTAAGQALLPHAEGVLDLAAAARGSADQRPSRPAASSAEGSTLSAPETLLTYRVPTILEPVPSGAPGR